jgi:hypothetical protein
MGKCNSYFTSGSTCLQTESFELDTTTLTLNKLTFEVHTEKNKQKYIQNRVFWKLTAYLWGMQIPGKKKMLSFINSKQYTMLAMTAI